MNVKCKYDVLMDVHSLKPYPKNRNQHTKDQIKRLAALLEYQGIRAPIVMAKLPWDCIAKGHGTLEAIKLNGWKEAPVVYQDFDNEEQLYAYVQSDNAIQSWAELDLAGINSDIGDLGPDFDIDLLGIKDFVLEPADKFNGDPDDVPEVKTTEIKRGDLFQLGEHRVLCGDATCKEDVERLMNGEKADMVFTDPPYGDIKLIDDDGQYIHSKNKTYTKYNGDGQFQFDGIYEVLIGISNRIVLWGGNCFANKLPISTCWIVWDKAVSENNGGNWFSDCELAWTNLRMPILKIRHVLQGYNKESKEERFHPTQKPVDFIIKAFDRITSSARSKFSTLLISDLFLGSGSTLIACEKTGRKCYGMEIEPLYVQVVLDRWAKFTGKEPVKV